MWCAWKCMKSCVFLKCLTKPIILLKDCNIYFNIIDDIAISVLVLILWEVWLIYSKSETCMKYMLGKISLEESSLHKNAPNIMRIIHVFFLTILSFFFLSRLQHMNMGASWIKYQKGHNSLQVQRRTNDVGNFVEKPEIFKGPRSFCDCQLLAIWKKRQTVSFSSIHYCLKLLWKFLCRDLELRQICPGS